MILLLVLWHHFPHYPVRNKTAFLDNISDAKQVGILLCIRRSLKRNEGGILIKDDLGKFSARKSALLHSTASVNRTNIHSSGL